MKSGFFDQTQLKKLSNQKTLCRCQKFSPNEFFSAESFDISLMYFDMLLNNQFCCVVQIVFRQGKISQSFLNQLASIVYYYGKISRKFWCCFQKSKIF